MRIANWHNTAPEEQWEGLYEIKDDLKVESGIVQDSIIKFGELLAIPNGKWLIHSPVSAQYLISKFWGNYGGGLKKRKEIDEN